MKIHGIAYLIVGLVVVAFSWYTNARTESSKMTIFLLIGVFFIVVGLVKLLYALVHKQKKEARHTPLRHPNQNPLNHPAHHSTHPNQPHQVVSHSHFPSHHHPQHSQAHETFPSHKTCSACNANNALQAQFCMRCGNRF